VQNMNELEKYRWCGHGAIMGRVKYIWQDSDYVLSWFGKKEGEAKREYRKFVEAGIGQGRRPDLVGGGLIRSLGGWSEVVSLRRNRERVLSDERILGSGDFVEKVYLEADEKMKYQLPAKKIGEKVEQLIEEVCEKEGINVNELRMGSRRGRIPQVRSQVACQLVDQHGIPLAEVARQLGVSTSAISKALRRATEK
jgi:hypothetical protein